MIYRDHPGCLCRRPSQLYHSKPLAFFSPGRLSPLLNEPVSPRQPLGRISPWVKSPSPELEVVTCSQRHLANGRGCRFWAPPVVAATPVGPMLGMEDERNLNCCKFRLIKFHRWLSPLNRRRITGRSVDARSNALDQVTLCQHSWLSPPRSVRS
jgi:hypothetical protein